MSSPTAEKPTVRALALAAWDAKWALLFPVALLLAIRGGVFTPSEVGAFAVVYALVIGFLAHRELTLAKVWRAFGARLVGCRPHHADHPDERHGRLRHDLPAGAAEPRELDARRHHRSRT